MEKWQLEKIAKKHRIEGGSSSAVVGGRKKLKGQQKEDWGLPVQKYPTAENSCSVQSNRDTVT